MLRRGSGSLIDHRNDRSLPDDYDGNVLLWDIDKTYLETHFSSLRGLAAIPFEFAIDKRSVPGSVTLLRALRRGAGEHSAIVPLFFVSGSPPQLRRVIERRMTMDGVEFDGITFKDQWGLLLRGRPKALKQQVGYKLTALLMYRRAVPAAARWWMFGDDVEEDAEVFALFGEVCAGLRGAELERRLASHRVHADDVRMVREHSDGLEVADDPVERIFIHLERNTDPARFTNAKVVPTHSYVQAALVLCERGLIKPDAVTAVARSVRRSGVVESTMADYLRDASERLAVPDELVALAQP